MRKLIVCLLVILLGWQPIVSAATYGILVNTSKHTTTVYEQINGAWVKLGTVKCSNGAHGKTPKGEFEIYKKKSYFIHDGIRYNEVSYFSENCAFHSVPFYDGKYDNSSLGHARSGGCIRLPIEAAKWIRKYCKVGTKVIIK